MAELSAATWPAADPAARRQATRRTAAFVVGIMLLMACTGLVLALVTWRDRRSHDTGLSQAKRRSPHMIEDEAGPVAPVAPDRLAALGYLPRGTSFILAARVVEINSTETGQRLLRTPVRVGDLAVPLTELVRMTGLEMEQIDHLVLGMKLENRLPLFTLVLRTRQPYDTDELRRQLKAEQIAHEGKKRLYRIRLSRLPVPLVVWFADEQTLVLGLDDSQVEAAPEKPRTDLSQLPDELQTTIRERHAAVAPLWLAAHAADWSKTLVRPILERLAQKSWPRLREVHTFALWINLDTGITADAVLHCPDARSAAELHEYLRPLLSSDPKKVRLAREGSWVLLQMPVDPAVVERLLEKDSAGGKN
jgi:hypothetical protein